MIDVSMHVIKDAAEAADKLVDTLRKLGELFADTANKGYELIIWNTARRLKNKVKGIHSRSTLLWATPMAAKATLEQFIADPQPDDWPALAELFDNTLKELQSLSRELKSNANDLSTLPFYSNLLVTLDDQERALVKVCRLGAPQSSDDLRNLKEFLGRYGALVEQFAKLNDAIVSFLERPEHSAPPAS
jgi:hypothetical protein